LNCLNNYETVYKTGYGRRRDKDGACMQRAFTLHISACPSSSHACPAILIKMLTTKNIKQIFQKGHNAIKQQTELSEVNSNHTKCCIINVTVHIVVVPGNVYSF